MRAGDFNGDGKLDLFVGGRLNPRQWPLPTRSFILRNDGGRFTDVTESVAPELVKPGGMITDAAWVDFDGDGKLDLVTVGEWMTIRFYRNDGTQLRDVTASTKLPSMRGWWSSLAVGDFDGDGRPDLVAGNLGLNYGYMTSKDTVFGVYAGDFPNNLGTDIVLTQRIGKTEWPLAGMVPLGRELYTLGLKFPTYGSFAEATMPQLFRPSQLQKATHYEADTFASVFLHNDGGGAFTATPLPDLAQISPIRGIVVHDVDGDGHLDLIVAGNLYDAEPNMPRADAGNGLWLRGDGHGHFTPVSPRESGLLAHAQRGRHRSRRRSDRQHADRRQHRRLPAGIHHPPPPASPARHRVFALIPQLVGGFACRLACGLNGRTERSSAPGPLFARPRSSALRRTRKRFPDSHSTKTNRALVLSDQRPVRPGCAYQPVFCGTRVSPSTLLSSICIVGIGKLSCFAAGSSARREICATALLVTAADAVDVRGERRLHDAPAPQVEEALAFHRQLEATLGTDRRRADAWSANAGYGLMLYFAHVMLGSLIGTAMFAELVPGPCAFAAARVLTWFTCGSRVGKVTRLDLRLCQQQQDVGVAEDVDVHRVELRVHPAHAALRARSPSRARSSSGCTFHRSRMLRIQVAVVQTPILVRHAIAADRPVQARIEVHARRDCGARGPGCPRSSCRIRHRQRQTSRVGLEEVDQVLRRLMEAAAAERAARVREVEPLAVVGVVAVRLTVVRRGLIGEDRLLPVLVLP